MALSETQVANIALTDLGQPTIASLDDDVTRARLAKARFADVRDGVLELPPPWNFATRRTTLTATLSTSPAWGFGNAFALPTDFLRHVTLEDQDADFRYEHDTTAGTVMVTDLTVVNLVYVAKVTDPLRWPHAFAEAVAAKLAAELSIPLTRNRELSQQMHILYRDRLDEARLSDALQAPIETVFGSQWLNARLGADHPWRSIEDA